MSHSIRLRATITAAAILVTALMTSACSDNSTSGSTQGSGGSGKDISTTVFAPGVPTLAELYKGNDVAPPSTAPTPQAGKSIYWISCGQQVPVCALKAAEGQKAVEAIGWNFHLVDGNLNIGGAYLQGIRTAIAAKADAIVQDVQPCSSVQQADQEAKAAGVLLIGLESLDCSAEGGASLFSVEYVYNSMASDIGALWALYGAQSAAYIIDASQGKAQVINNPGNNPQQVAYDKGFTTELAKCSGCKIVDTVTWTNTDYIPNGPWIAKFRTALVQHPEANAVFMPFDEMPTSLGGAQAIREAGLKVCTGTPPFASGCIIAVDGIGTASVPDLISQGQWTATAAAYDEPWVAWGVVDQLNRAFNGQSSVSQGIGYRAIDSGHNLPASGQTYTAPVDWKSTYLKAWGKSN